MIKNIKILKENKPFEIKKVEKTRSWLNVSIDEAVTAFRQAVETEERYRAYLTRTIERDENNDL